MLKEKLAQFPKWCRERGLSLTAQRLAVYRDICATDTHPTAEEVFERIRKQYPALSLATVYKTLETFEKYDFVTKSRATGEKARYDANRNPHHHLICKACGRIEDVYDKSLLRLTLPEAGRKHFKVEDYRIEFRGLCKNCQTKVPGTKVPGLSESAT